MMRGTADDIAEDHRQMFASGDEAPTSAPPSHPSFTVSGGTTTEEHWQSVMAAEEAAFGSRPTQAPPRPAHYGPSHKRRNRRTFWVAVYTDDADALHAALLDRFCRSADGFWKMTNSTVSADEGEIRFVLVYEGRGGNIDDVRRRLDALSGKSGRPVTISRLEQHGNPEWLED